MTSDRVLTAAKLVILLLCGTIFVGPWAWYKLSMLAAHNKSYCSLNKHEQQKLAARILKSAGLAALPDNAELLSATNGRVFVTSSHRVIFKASKSAIKDWLLQSGIHIEKTNGKYNLDHKTSCHYEHGEIAIDYPNQRVIVYTADY